MAHDTAARRDVGAAAYTPHSDRADGGSGTRVPAWVWALVSIAFSWGVAVAAARAEMGAMRQQLDRIDERVSAMYCGQIPEPQRGACR